IEGLPLESQVGHLTFLRVLSTFWPESTAAQVVCNFNRSPSRAGQTGERGRAVNANNESITAIEQLVAKEESVLRRFEQKVEDSRKRLDAFQITLAQLRSTQSQPAPVSQVSVGVPVDELRGLSVLDAAVMIAKR